MSRSSGKPLRRLLLAALAATGVASTAERAAAQFPPPAPQPPFTPDLSGYWTLDRGYGLIQDPAKPGPAGLPRGWMVFRGWTAPGNEPPPLRPEVLDFVRKREQSELDGQVIDSRTLKCQPPNMFDMMTWGEVLDILQRPDALVMTHEKERALPRTIYIGAQHPPEADLVISHNGHAVGHWEGDTLVTDTVGLNPDTWLFVGDFIPHSDALHVAERIHLEDGGKALVVNWTIDDPKTFTRPWTLTARYNRGPPGMEVVEQVCDLDRRGDTLGN